MLNAIVTLLKYNGKSLLRERTLLFIVVLFPIILILAAAASAPERALPLVLDGNPITPAPDADEVVVALYSITATALVMSILSFFAAFQLKHLIPRLKIQGYSLMSMILALVALLIVVDIFVSFLVTVLAVTWIQPHDYWGIFVSMLLGGLLFGSLGILIAYMVDSKHLGLNVILTIAVIDTGFLENPLYSRRYDEEWMRFMPAFGPVRMLLRATFDTGTAWTSELLQVLAYEVFIIVFMYLVIKILRK